MELMLEAFHMIVLSGGHITDLHIPQGMEDVADSQAEIGWDQMLQGRLSLQWRQKHETDLGPELVTDKKNGATWATNIVDSIFTQWWALWEQRNEDRHGKDRQSRDQAQHRQAIREMTQMYQMGYGPTTPPMDL